MSRKGKHFRYEKPYFYSQKSVPSFEWQCEQKFKDIADAKNLARKRKARSRPS